MKKPQPHQTPSPEARLGAVARALEDVLRDVEWSQVGDDSSADSFLDQVDRHHTPSARHCAGGHSISPRVVLFASPVNLTETSGDSDNNTIRSSAVKPKLFSSSSRDRRDFRNGKESASSAKGLQRANRQRTSNLFRQAFDILSKRDIRLLWVGDSLPLPDATAHGNNTNLSAFRIWLSSHLKKAAFSHLNSLILDRRVIPFDDIVQNLEAQGNADAANSTSRIERKSNGCWQATDVWLPNSFDASKEASISTAATHLFRAELFEQETSSEDPEFRTEHHQNPKTPQDEKVLVLTGLVDNALGDDKMFQIGAFGSAAQLLRPLHQCNVSVNVSQDQDHASTFAGVMLFLSNSGRTAIADVCERSGCLKRLYSVLIQPISSLLASVRRIELTGSTCNLEAISSPRPLLEGREAPCINHTVGDQFCDYLEKKRGAVSYMETNTTTDQQNAFRQFLPPLSQGLALLATPFGPDAVSTFNRCSKDIQPSKEGTLPGCVAMDTTVSDEDKSRRGRELLSILSAKVTFEDSQRCDEGRSRDRVPNEGLRLRHRIRADTPMNFGDISPNAAEALRNPPSSADKVAAEAANEPILTKTINGIVTRGRQLFGNLFSSKIAFEASPRKESCSHECVSNQDLQCSQRPQSDVRENTPVNCIRNMPSDAAQERHDPCSTENKAVTEDPNMHAVARAIIEDIETPARSCADREIVSTGTAKDTRDMFESTMGTPCHVNTSPAQMEQGLIPVEQTSARDEDVDPGNLYPPSCTYDIQLEYVPPQPTEECPSHDIDNYSLLQVAREKFTDTVTSLSKSADADLEPQIRKAIRELSLVAHVLANASEDLAFTRKAVKKNMRKRSHIADSLHTVLEQKSSRNGKSAQIISSEICAELILAYEQALLQIIESVLTVKENTETKKHKKQHRRLKNKVSALLSLIQMTGQSICISSAESHAVLTDMFSGYFKKVLPRLMTGPNSGTFSDFLKPLYREYDQDIVTDTTAHTENDLQKSWRQQQPRRNAQGTAEHAAAAERSENASPGTSRWDNESISSIRKRSRCLDPYSQADVQAKRPRKSKRDDPKTVLARARSKAPIVEQVIRPQLARTGLDIKIAKDLQKPLMMGTAKKRDIKRTKLKEASQPRKIARSTKRKRIPSTILKETHRGSEPREAERRSDVANHSDLEALGATGALETFLPDADTEIKDPHKVPATTVPEKRDLEIVPETAVKPRDGSEVVLATPIRSKQLTPHFCIPPSPETVKTKTAQRPLTRRRAQKLQAVRNDGVPESPQKQNRSQSAFQNPLCDQTTSTDNSKGNSPSTSQRQSHLVVKRKVVTHDLGLERTEECMPSRPVAIQDGNSDEKAIMGNSQRNLPSMPQEQSHSGSKRTKAVKRAPNLPVSTRITRKKANGSTSPTARLRKKSTKATRKQPSRQARK